MSVGGKEPGPAPTNENVEALQREIESIRTGLDGMVDELDRRRHSLFDVRSQLRRHTVPLIALGAALLGIAAGGIALGVAHRRRRARLGPTSRIAFTKRCAGWSISRRRVANSPSVGRKIVAAGGAAAASVIAKRLAGNLLREGRARASREHS